jgi:transposase
VLVDESVPKAEYEKVVEEREQYRELYLKALEQCRKLELGILGQKRERLSPSEAQLSIALLAALVGAAGAEIVEAQAASEPEGQRVREHVRKKPTGRKPLPKSLPRVEIEVVPPEVERDGRDAYERIGEDVSETVERRPASLVVVRIKRGKFVRKDRERNDETEVLVGETPELPIDRGLAGPALLADTIVRRWQDHLPLNRLEQIYAREGLELARSTVCTWHAELAALVAPLIVAMWKDALASPYLCTDATGVLVQAKEKCKNGHFWVVVAPERHVLYAYSERHEGAAVDRLLAGYQGYLVADAHAVYDHLYKTGEVVEVACWAHARRYFFKALASDPERARAALALIGALFAIERQIADAPPGKRQAVRLRESRPLVDRFFAWCDAEAERVLDETPIARAIGYARNQRVALQRFLEDARLPIHNNTSELSLRREVIGRKNWLFLGSDAAGGTNAAFVSLLASCQLHGIEPFAYLRDLLCLLPAWPKSRVLELAPVHWQKTVQQDDAQQRLAANVFRRVSLGLPVEHQPIK